MASKALEAAIKAFKSVPLSYNDDFHTVPVAIKQFLTHHLEHPEAVARAVQCKAAQYLNYGLQSSDCNSLAKAALQCLIEDLT